MLSSLVITCLLQGCDPSLAGEGEASTREPTGAVDEPRPGGEIGTSDESGGCSTRAPRVPAARVMFVLDRSSSMGAGSRESAPALLGGPSRWARSHALVTALAERLEGAAQLGAALFPSGFAEVVGEAAQCDVLDVPDVAIGPVSAEQLLARLPAADEVDFTGGSPATQAMWTALQHISALEIGPRTVIVLVTDGGANCADDDAPLTKFDDDLVDVVAFARDEMAVPTFVVAAAPASEPQSVPAVDAREALREIALAGGASGYFDVRDARGLAAAIEAELEIEQPAPAACP